MLNIAEHHHHNKSKPFRFPIKRASAGTELLLGCHFYRDTRQAQVAANSWTEIIRKDELSIRTDDSSPIIHQARYCLTQTFKTKLIWPSDWSVTIGPLEDCRWSGTFRPGVICSRAEDALTPDGSIKFGRRKRSQSLQDLSSISLQSI